MRYPKEALLFKVTKAGHYLTGEVVEFAGPSFQPGYFRAVKAFNSSTSGNDYGWQHCLKIDDVAPLTPASKGILDKLPNILGCKDGLDFAEVTFDPAQCT